MKKIFFLLSLSIGVLSCNQQSNNSDNSDSTEKTDEQTSFNELENLEIYINDSGEIRVDGMVKNLGELEPMLEELKNDNGVVHYYRSPNYQGDVWEDVLDLVTKYELPLAFFTDETFTEKAGF